MGVPAAQHPPQKGQAQRQIVLLNALVAVVPLSPERRAPHDAGEVGGDDLIKVLAELLAQSAAPREKLDCAPWVEILLSERQVPHPLVIVGCNQWGRGFSTEVLIVEVLDPERVTVGVEVPRQIRVVLWLSVSRAPQAAWAGSPVIEVVVHSDHFAQIRSIGPAHPRSGGRSRPGLRGVGNDQHVRLRLHIDGTYLPPSEKVVVQSLLHLLGTLDGLVPN